MDDRIDLVDPWGLEASHEEACQNFSALDRLMYGTAEEKQRQQENEAAVVHEAIMSGNAQAGRTVPEPKGRPTQSGRPALRVTPKVRARPREDASRSRTRSRSPSPRPKDSTPEQREEMARSSSSRPLEFHPEQHEEFEEIMAFARWLHEGRDHEDQASTAPARSEVPVPPWRQPSNAATTAAPDAAPAASRAEPTAESWFQPAAKGCGRRGEAYRPRLGNPRGPRNGNRGGKNRRWYAARSLAAEEGWLDTFLRLQPRRTDP